MPKFLVEATYTAEGHKGLAKDKASGRKTAIAQAVKKLGGKLDAIYFCLGENDVILIADLPDYISAAAFGSAACATPRVPGGQPCTARALTQRAKIHNPLGEASGSTTNSPGPTG